MAAIHRYQQIEYKRWIRILNGVYKVKDALHLHARHVFENFHREQIRKYKRFQCKITSLQLERDEDNNTWIIRGTHACTHECVQWLNAISSLHPEGNSTDVFKYCNLTDLKTDSWEIANTFLPRHTSSAEELESDCLMKMITQCELFSHESVDLREAVERVLPTVNSLEYFAVHGIQSESEMLTKMKDMIKLAQQLDNPNSVTELEQIRDEEMDLPVGNVQEVQRKEVCIFSEYLDAARQNRGDNLDGRQREVLEFLRKQPNSDLWQMMENTNPALTSWGEGYAL